jgi:nucleoid DNA-binding protein
MKKPQNACQIYKIVAKKSGVDINKLSIVFPIFFSEILEAIKDGRDVNIKGFCKFYVNDRPGHYQDVIGGWNKSTNKPIRKRMYCRPKKRVRFRPMKFFQEAVAELNIREFGDQAFNTKERNRRGQRK